MRPSGLMALRDRVGPGSRSAAAGLGALGAAGSGAPHRRLSLLHNRVVPNLRPSQPDTPARDAFEIHRAKVAQGLSLGYLREGVGGYPLLLVHGYPETKRIWWRNVRPLAAAGFEVIVPALRGYGDSDLSEEDAYDIVLYSRDLYALVHDVLGHERCGLLAGDVGGVVICDLANRYPGFVDRMVVFNTIAPMIADQAGWYAARGLSINPLEPSPTVFYLILLGRDWI